MSIFVRKKQAARIAAEEILAEIQEDNIPLPETYCIADVANFLEAFGTINNCRLNKMTSKQRETAKLQVIEAIHLLDKLKSNISFPQAIYAHALLGNWVRHIGLNQLCYRKELSLWKRIITIYRHW
ncbi:hypothetical protein AB3D14_000774 [Vibrio alginolyticus]|uniref:hypothetical protein n=1 Tax=Vibrio alginolyticus TaxID=663 RepID=UPI00215B9A3B|nr:hypothetical protein [Vibrio alginolyticus]MCR9328421.1 hypothetical protein [Vibrio alginolyticus]MCR9356793.1 hypothetical protein [Vibrio alginolyticus]